MNNFTKKSGRAYWHSITNLTCSPVLRKLQTNSIKALMLFMFFTLSTGALFAQTNPNTGGGFLADTIDGCMLDVPAATPVADLMASSDFDACRDASGNVFVLIPNTEFNTPGEWGVSSGYTDGSTDCSWTFYYVYTLKCAGEITPYTVQYNGGDGTRPTLIKGAVIPPGAKDLNLCYANAPAATPIEDIKALYYDNCQEHLAVDNYVTMRTKSKSDDCKWIIIYVYTIWDGCTEPVEISITYTGGDTEAPWFTSDLPTKEITVDCDSIPEPVILNWDDNCTEGRLRVQSTDDTSQLGIGCAGGIITRSWEITDDCGNHASYSQTINVRPAPQVYFVQHSNIDVPCEDRDNIASYIPRLEYTNGLTDSRCRIHGYADPVYTVLDANCGSFQVTYTFTDDCGNTINSGLTVTIIDEENPAILTAARDKTVECDGDGNIEEYNNWLANNGGATASDNCDTDLTWSNDDASHPFTDECGATGYKTVIFTVSDDCGNQSKTFATFKIVDTTDPVIRDVAQDLRVVCDGAGNINQYQVWLDNHGGATATDDCSNVYWSDNSKSQNFTDECGATGQVTITFTATDDCGRSSDTTASFIIEDSIAPVISTPASDMTVECDGSVHFWIDFYLFLTQVKADSYGTNNASKFLEWYYANGGAIADPDLCSDIEWDVTNAYLTGNPCDYNINLTFTVSDACGNESTTSATFHVIDTNSPAIGQEAVDMTVECDGQGNTTQFNDWLANNGGATAMDACSSITWSNDYNDRGLSDLCGLTGAVTVLFTVTDECGLSSSTAAEFRIQDTTAPTFTAPDDIVIYKDAVCGYDASLNITFDVTNESDGCSSASYPLEAKPSDRITVGDCPGDTIITRTWSLIDECGNEAPHQIQIITVKDVSAPVLTGTLPTAAETSNLDLCEAPAGLSEADFAALYTDNCTVLTADLVTKTTNVIQTGECSWATQYTYVIRDECGNTLDPVKILYFGRDQSKPELAKDMVLPADNYNLTTCLDEALIGDGAGATTDAVYKLFTDHCDNDVSVYKSPEPVYVGQQGCDYHYYWVFRIVDNCDNTYTFEQHFSGSDNDAPVLVGIIPDGLSDIDECKDHALYGHNGDDTPPVAAGPTRGAIAALYSECSGYGNVYVEKETTTFGTDCNWGITHQYTISDDCGNIADIVKITYTGSDKTKPIIIDGYDAMDKTVELDCDTTANGDAFDVWVANHGGAMAYDDCDANLGWTYTVVEDGTACARTSTVTFKAIDDCGNFVTTTAVFTIEDTTGPKASNPADVAVECQVDVPAPDVNVVIDEADCNGTAVTFVNDIVDISNAPDLVITRTYRITDDCDNSTDVTQTIIVEDVTAPEITCSGDITVNGTANGAEVDYTAPMYSDNCDPSPSISFSHASGDVFLVGDTTVTITVVDASGNDASCSFVVTVVDTTSTAPGQAVDSGADVTLDFRAYPVPFNKDVNLKYNFNFDTDITIEVYDTKGLLVLRKDAKGYRSGSDMTLPLRITGADQLYYVKLITNRGTVIKKIVSSNIQQ